MLVLRHRRGASPQVRLAVNRDHPSKLLKDRDTFMVDSEWIVVGDAMTPAEAARAARRDTRHRSIAMGVNEEEALGGGDASLQSMLDMEHDHGDGAAGATASGTEGDCLITLATVEAETAKSLSASGKQYSTITFAFTVQRRVHYYLFNV